MIITKLINVFTLTMMIIFGFHQAGLACSAPKKGATFTSFEELIDKTDQIVLAKYTIDILTDQKEDHYFAVQEVIKGLAGKRIVTPLIRASRRMQYRISNRPGFASVYGKANDLDSHNDPKFWKRVKNNTAFWPSGSCVPRIYFIEGASYLLFVDSYASKFSAELIQSPSDKWYLFVKDRVSKKQ